jgi:squalene cyclase
MTAGTLALKEAIASGLNYILARQAEDGSWTEWALPPGSSSMWATAYVGFKLRNLPLDLASMATPRIMAAARWLSDHVLADDGWGYNEIVGSDADSTSYAILFLASVGHQVPDASYTILHILQRADGGFATYLPIGKPNSWNVSHPDVTPIALLALLAHPEPYLNAIQRGIEYVQWQETSLGLWNSFWWGSSLYGTEASLSLLDAVGIVVPLSYALTQIQPANAFELALMISSLLHVDCDGSRPIIRDLVNKLINQQQPDGSWNTAPILRITWRDCYEPWASANAGQLYAETSRLFTTATALHALARVHEAIEGKS